MVRSELIAPKGVCVNWLETLESRELLSAAPLLHVSANGRYFVDANNHPFYVVGDSAWVLPTALTEQQAGQYMQQRAAQGFNAILMDANLQTNFGGPNDTNGNPPFTANLPGSSNFDVTKPNAAYWQHIDNLINMASQDGLEIVLDVWDNYSPFLAANSTANLKTYGQFLGKRYADFNNVIWMFGNDYLETAEIDTDMAAVMQGIRQFDTKHLMTLEGFFDRDGPITSYGNAALRQYVNVDGIYYYPGLYGEGPYRPEYLSEYNRSDFGPLLNLETHYEAGPVSGGNDGSTTDAAGIRQQDYDFLLNGATGNLYGNITVWKFDAGWQQQTTNDGAQQMRYFVSLQKSLPWQNLVPDQTGAVFPGVGTPDDYSGAYTPDGTLALAYQTSSGAGAHSFAVNMGHFSAPVTAQWYDPTNGAYTAIGAGLPNSGTTTFTSPSANSAGQNDFVLVLKTTNGAGAPVIAIDSGGGGSGAFSPDAAFSGGRTLRRANRINRSPVSNAPSNSVYDTQRYGNFTYTIGRLKARAAYTLRLHFAELYLSAPGSRLFDVSINGTQVLTNFDIFAAAGAKDTATVQQLTTHADRRGRLTITFTSVKNTACLAGLEVLTAG